MDGLDQLLLEAAEDGHAALCLDLLKRGADSNAKDHEDWTPLHFAAHYGHMDLTSILLISSPTFALRRLLTQKGTGIPSAGRPYPASTGTHLAS